MAPSAAIPGGFCADCFSGNLGSDAPPAGREERLHGLDVYVTGPVTFSAAPPVGLVVIVTDVFGWRTASTRALADAYARRGPFVVYVPDFMAGAAPPESIAGLFDGLAAPSTSWFTTLVRKPLLWFRIWGTMLPVLYRIRESVVRPRMWAFFRALRPSSSPASAPPAGLGADFGIGVAGFCWGGRYVALLCADNTSCASTEPLVNCGFTAHPSLLAVPAEVEPIVRPFSVANGPEDEWLSAPKMAELKEILEKKDGCEVVLYPGAKHGFAVRGSDSKQVELGMQAQDQAVSWFRRQFS